MHLRFYLLFQQHTTPELAHTHGLYGGSSYSQLLQLGPRVALAMPDQRAERTVHQVRCGQMKQRTGGLRGGEG
jgi:hypothetical protein